MDSFLDAARGHSASRFLSVMPEQPISCGKCSLPTPVPKYLPLKRKLACLQDIGGFGQTR